MFYQPDRILIDSQVLSSPICQRICSQYGAIEQVVLENSAALSEVLGSNVSLTQGKRHLLLKKYQGSAFKLCPGFSEDLLCCNYYVLDLIENCPLECTYCILQVFLNNPLIVFHLNIDEILEQTLSEIEKYPDRPFRIGTGEHSDSLALDHIFQVNPYLVERFSRLTNAVLELKTKTDMVEPLKGLEHKGRTVIAWSLNPPEIIQNNEFKTAPLEKRLQAASSMILEGYKVAFHFDPIIFYPNWRSGYRQVIEMMFDYVLPNQIAWISLGTLRYIPALKTISEERFPKVSIFCNEFIAAKDGKMRYLKKIRKELLQTISGWIRLKGKEIPLYLCMEKHSLWHDMMTVCPEDSLALEKYLSSNV